MGIKHHSYGTLYFTAPKGQPATPREIEYGQVVSVLFLAANYEHGTYICGLTYTLLSPTHSAWSESSRSYSVATGHRPERSDCARDTGVRSDSDRETDYAYPGNRRYKYVGPHRNRFATYDFLFDFNRHYGSILNRLAGNKLLRVYTSGL